MLPVDETSSFVGYCCREFSWKLHRIIRSAPPRSGFWLSWVGQQVFFVQLVQRRFFRQQKMIVQDSVLVQKSENHWGNFVFYTYITVFTVQVYSKQVIESLSHFLFSIKDTFYSTCTKLGTRFFKMCNFVLIWREKWGSRMNLGKYRRTACFGGCIEKPLTRRPSMLQRI